jgi:hypothetical protein
MATYYQWKCESCSYMVETNGPHEFYIASHGQRQRYGHPLPRSKEAEEAGVAGLTVVAYCPVCDEAHEVVIEEFDPPRNFITCWLGAHNLIEPTCPECGSTILTELPGLPCPRCPNGVFAGRVVKYT